MVSQRVTTMIISAKVAASRANGLKSRGPVSAEGKKRSKRNAVKHGLRGEGVVLPEDLATAAEAKTRSLAGALNPADDCERELVARMGLAAARSQACAQAEAARMRVRQREAVKLWDQAQADRVAQWAARL